MVDISDLFGPERPEAPALTVGVEGWSNRIKKHQRRDFEREYVQIGRVSRILARGHVRYLDNLRLFWCGTGSTRCMWRKS